jgi:FkbM family methyltransferase
MHEIVKEGVIYRFEKTSDDAVTHEWLLQYFSTWEPYTFQCFRKVADPSKVAIDIGAWIGLTGIWLSKHFKHVVCVEADRVAVDALRANLEASGSRNYTLFDKAIYHTNTTLYFGPNSFRNSVLNDSMSQLKTISDKGADYPINTITITDITRGIPTTDIGFIKVDIEGGEEFIMEDIMNFSSQNKIAILISFHILWWKHKDVTRFVHLFKTSRVESDAGEIIINVGEYLKHNPMGSLFCTYPIII